MRYGKGLPEKIRRAGCVPVYGSNGIVGEHDAAVTRGPAIIVGRKGSVGAVHHSLRSCWPIDTTYFIDQFGPFEPKFLLLLLRHLDLAQHESSTAIPGLSRDDAYHRDVLVAPVAEQRRIVERVEELLAGIEVARDHLAKLPAILRRFRQSMLAAACSASLKEDYRMPAQHQAECRVGDSPDPSEIWNESTLASLTLKIGSGATPRGGSQVYVSSGVPLIRSQNIHFDGFRDEGLAWLTAEQAKALDSVTVKENDVLLNITGASIGRLCVAPARMDGARVNQHVAIIRARREAIEPSFLAFVLASPAVQARINSEEYGVTRQALTKAWISALEIQLPSISEQKAIIGRAGALFTVARNTEHHVSAAAAGADMLTRCILDKALRGELVPTESELARAEGRDYESAEALLQRIVSERRTGKGRC